MLNNIANHKSNIQLCNCCPRKCNADRNSHNLGYCKTDNSIHIGSICIHKGEEPVLGGKKGICNVFFSHCNLQCIYCQNKQISQNNETEIEYQLTIEETIKIIINHLDKDVNYIGFVSPSHCIIQVKQIITKLNQVGYKPIVVYNSNGYDDVQSLKDLSSLIDIYLPDFKYSDNTIAYEYSDVKDYKEKALAAIKEMYYQKGSVLHKNENGLAESGLIIRHLVLPGAVNNSIEVLRLLAEEISVNVHLSLMSQYFPNDQVLQHPILKKCLTRKEYDQVISEMEKFGFTKGWVQDLESNNTYQPDFSYSHPFDYKH